MGKEKERREKKKKNREREMTGKYTEIKRDTG